MRIRSLHVDGFGALSDFDCVDLSAGLVVLLGPNEAGKSTLRDFVTGMLFGFPARRQDPRFRAPVRGGRHGGVLSFVDDAGGEWTVERYVTPQRALTVRMPDGRLGSEADLARVLGNASAGLYRTIFAIGLDELATIDTASTDEARELLFASSVFGERQSAARAIRSLSESAAELARMRQADARANRLQHELESVRAQLSAARAATNNYESLRRELERRDAETRHRRDELGAGRRRERELTALIRCWPVSVRLSNARSEMANLPTPDPRGGRLSTIGPELKELSAEFSGHQERTRKLVDLRRQHVGLTRSIADRFERLGAGWTDRAVRATPSVEALSRELSERRNELVERERSVAAASALLESAESEIARAEASLAAAASSPAPRGAGVLRDQREAVGELRQRLVEIDALAASVSTRPAGDDRVRTGWAAVAALVAFVLASAMGSALFATGNVVLGSVAVVVAAVAAVAGLLTARRALSAWGTDERSIGRRARGHTGGHIGGRPRQSSASFSSEQTTALERARGRAHELARGLDLPLPPSRVDVERLDVALQRELEGRLALDLEISRRDDARWRHERASQAVGVAHGELDDARERLGNWLEMNGFSRHLEPDEALHAVSIVGSLQDDLESRERLAFHLEEAGREVARFDERCELVADTLSLERPLHGDGLGEWLLALVDLMDDVAALAARRLALTSAIDADVGELERSLGAGEDAERLGAELETGEIWRWEREHDQLVPWMESLTTDEEASIRAHESLSRELDQLATSSRIAELEQRAAALEEELDGTLRRYAVLGTAKALLQETLHRHQRERQPAVIATAAGHFARITADRYTGLLADEGPDAIRVLAASGASLDATSLSRGTMEQLYLCLRLGLAGSFSMRGVRLPLVLDDVLVNFDPARAAAVAAELASVAGLHQIFFMTCHRHLAELMTAQAGCTRAQVVELERL